LHDGCSSALLHSVLEHWFAYLILLGIWTLVASHYHGWWWRCGPPSIFYGYGELSFDSEERAWETALTAKVGSRRANCPILACMGDSNGAYRHGGLRVRVPEWAVVKAARSLQLEGKPGASSRGNSSSNGVYSRCCA